MVIERNIYWYEEDPCYRVKVGVNGKDVHVGTFHHLAEAREAKAKFLKEVGERKAGRPFPPASVAQHFYTRKEVCDLFDCELNSIKYMMQKGLIKYKRLGEGPTSSIVFSKNIIDNMLKERKSYISKEEAAALLGIKKASLSYHYDTLRTKLFPGSGYMVRRDAVLEYREELEHNKKTNAGKAAK